MKHVIYTCGLLLTVSLILSSCEKEPLALSPVREGVESVDPIIASTLSMIRGAQFAIVSTSIEGYPTPPIDIRGIVSDMNGNAQDFQTFSIGGINFPANLNDEDIRNGDATGQLYYTYADYAPSLEEYNKVFESLYSSPTDLVFESRSLGSLKKEISLDKPLKVDLSANDRRKVDDIKYLNPTNGINIKWEASQNSAKSSDEVFIAVVYHASRTERLYENQNIPLPSHMPSKNMTYSVTTSNDGDHTIDMSNIQDFPAGGVYTLTVGTGTKYTFNIDDSNNTITVTSAAIDSSDDIIFTPCGANSAMVDCDCTTFAC